MIHVEMVVYIVVVRADELVLNRVLPAGKVGEEHLRLDLLADESRHSLGKVDFYIGKEERVHAILRRVLPAVVRHLVRDIGIRLGLFRLVRGKPLLPCRLRLWQVLHEAIAVVAGIPFVYEREEREGRLVGPTATGLGVDMVEKLARKVEIVPEGAIVEEHKLLVFLHLNYAVAVNAAGTPGDVPRDEEVCRQVYAVADAGVQEVVELGHLLGADRRAVLPVA